MRILLYEIKKIFGLPLIWIFLLFCLMLNTVVICADYNAREYVEYISNTAVITGTRMGNAFNSALSELPQSEYRDRLIMQTEGVRDILDNSDITVLADIYNERLGLDGFWAAQIDAKYEKLQSSADYYGEIDAALELYAADMTYFLHNKLFSVVFRLLTTETCLLAVLITLYLFGYEHQAKTELVVYSTYRGRKLNRRKLISALSGSLICFIIISTITLITFFTVWKCSGLLSSSVSSVFNYVRDNGMQKPFLTWTQFNVSEYLVAMIGLSAILCLIFSLLAAVIGLRVRNTYIGFLLFVIIALCMLAAPLICADLGLWGGYFLLMYLPVQLWYVVPLWFTDLGAIAIFPYHEINGILLNLFVLPIILTFCYRLFQRRDII